MPRADWQFIGYRHAPAILFPPLAEQRAIVRYLDHVDRRIRRYVGAKRKLIALLEEEKQAVINQAVTRGLDPNVRLKPSGVEWLGDVPEHWEVPRRLFRVHSSSTDPKTLVDGTRESARRCSIAESINHWFRSITHSDDIERRQPGLSMVIGKLF